MTVQDRNTISSSTDTILINSARLQRFLNPRSIAVIGGKEAERVIRQCLKLGFEGEIWAVNPIRKTLAGIRCIDGVGELSFAPDATFIAIPAQSTIDTVRELDRMGAGGAVCYASGFREVGKTGIPRHAQLVSAAGDMPVLGPNCYGYINALRGAALWPDQMGLTSVDKGVAIFSSSGNIGLNLTLQRRGLNIAWLVTLGNQAVMGVEQAMAAALDNDRITAIGIHIEGLTDLPRFIEMTDKARCKKIPVVVLKSGRSAAGARIAQSHTATLAGNAELYDALFTKLGIGHVHTLEEFLETLKLLSICGPIPGNRIASMSCSGGEASLMADLSIDSTLEFGPLADTHKMQIQKTLNEFVNVDNPLDYHTFIWGDFDRMMNTFSAMMVGNQDMTLLVLDYPTVNDCEMDEWVQASDALIEATRRTGQSACVVASLPENLPDEVKPTLIHHGITPLYGMQQALKAVEVASQIGIDWQQRSPLPLITFQSEDRHVRMLNENQAKSWLVREGLKIPDARVAHTAQTAIKAAEEIGYPVVVKALCEQIIHKTESGAVSVNVGKAEEVAVQAVRMLTFSSDILIERMIDGVIAELLVGVLYDPQFGHYLVVGTGGTLVELIRDRQLLFLPVEADQVRAALQKLRIYPLLTGYRGRVHADVESVIDTVVQVGQLAVREQDSIVELEINPLLVRAKGHGAIVADALVRVRE